MDDGYVLDAPITVTAEEIEAVHGKVLVDRKPNKARSDREMTWLTEYLSNGFNATQAGLAAGYSQSTAEVHCPLWVKERREDSYKPDFWDIVRQARRRRLSHLDATRERVMLEYSRIAFFDPETMYDSEGNLLPIHQMPEDTRRAIAGYDVSTVGDAMRVSKIKMSQKTAALKDLSSILGINKEVVVVEHKFSDLLKEVQATAPLDPLVIEGDIVDE